MAKRRRRQSNQSSKQRGYQYNSKPNRLLFRSSFKKSLYKSYPILPTKQWRPSNDRNITRTIYGKKAKLKTDYSSTSNKPFIRTRLSWADPRRVVTCIRRNRRRISLFAKGSIGSGRRISKKRRFTQDSKVRC